MKTTNATEARKKLIEKVQKLLALTSSPEQGEAQNALRLAQKLIAEHNLLESEYSETEGAEIVDIAIEESTKTLSHHRSAICAVLSNHFPVQTYIRSNRLHVLGYEHDVTAFIALFEYTSKAYNKMFTTYLNAHRDIITTRSEATRAKNSYLLSFIAGVNEALTRNEQENALVLVMQEPVRKAAEALHLINLKPRRLSINSDHQINSTANEAGRRDGIASQSKSTKSLL